MHKKTRKRLFYISIFIFAILSAVVVLFSLGYKYDFVNNKIVKTGSFRVATNHSGAEIYINYRLAGKTSFLSNNFSKGGFLPRTYDIRVEKDGYIPWEKKITIESGFFTDFPAIVLMRDDLAFVLTASASSRFGNPWLGFDENSGFAYLGERQGGNKPVSFAVRAVGGGEVAGGFDVPLSVINKNPIIFDKNFYFIDKAGLYVYDTGLGQTRLLSAGVKSFSIDRDRFMVADLGDNLTYSIKIKTGNDRKDIAEISTGYSFKKAITAGGSYYFILSNNSGNALFEFKNGGWLKIKDGVSDVSLSPDNKKIAYFTDREVWVRWILPTSSQPTRLAGDEEFITRFSSKISQSFWYKDSEHLLIKTGDILKFIEIDGRGGNRNIIDLADIGFGQFVYKNNLIGILNGSSLFLLN